MRSIVLGLTTSSNAPATISNTPSAALSSKPILNA
jgi:hypothetical protein